MFNDALDLQNASSAGDTKQLDPAALDGEPLDGSGFESEQPEPEFEEEEQ